jgi:tetratricopeptide (TPR) repeat protein
MKDPQFTGSVGAMISTKPGLSKPTYLYGIELLKTLLGTPQPPAMIYNLIAKAYENMGDYKAAVESQEKAITEAKESLKEGKYTGFILEDTVKEYEKTLEEYKKNLK